MNAATVPDFPEAEIVRSPNAHAAVEEMTERGGRFVKNLANSWMSADPGNRAKLEAAFPELWEKYSAMAAKKEGGQ